MPRGKIAMRLVENARARAATCGRRTRGLQNKAKELATLCAVPVALVCLAAGAGSPPLVWESEEGVLERYRSAVPPEARAQHTHRGYLEAELGKERAKLARARHGCPAALADWDPALNDVTLAEARELLDAIDTALRAAGDRMEALGLPADGALDEQVAPHASDDAVMPQPLAHGGGVPCTGSNPVDMDVAGFQLQMVPWNGGDKDGLLGEDGFQMQPGCGFECIGGGNFWGAVDGTPAPGSGNAHYDWPGLTMWHADELCDTALPLGHYPNFADGTLAPEYSGQVVAGGNYMKTLPSGGYPMAMGVGDNFTLGSNYTAHWQAEESHRSGTSTSQLLSAASSPQCSNPGTRSSSQVFHYLR
ncbi:hypothetical protein D1007_01781 [Hordeum vulgare]|uniref:Predicted protein n=1 Tax=Hordeum vulgare subsp. vulgare TaxID=112509 RepID=F2EK87_HORVV|nr:hypothetical protein D1007_01781 [Hordeum vulgare]BAK07759.1 predicted protein [Hordeum vulgare subsp. vulgare]